MTVKMPENAIERFNSMTSVINVNTELRRSFVEGVAAGLGVPADHQFNFQTLTFEPRPEPKPVEK